LRPLSAWFLTCSGAGSKDPSAAGRTPREAEGAATKSPEKEKNRSKTDKIQERLRSRDFLEPELGVGEGYW